MKNRSDNPRHHERTLLPRSYISLLNLYNTHSEIGTRSHHNVHYCYQLNELQCSEALFVPNQGKVVRAAFRTGQAGKLHRGLHNEGASTYAYYPFIFLAFYGRVCLNPSLKVAGYIQFCRLFNTYLKNNSTCVLSRKGVGTVKQ